MKSLKLWLKKDMVMTCIKLSLQIFMVEERKKDLLKSLVVVDLPFSIHKVVQRDPPLPWWKIDIKKKNC